MNKISKELLDSIRTKTNWDITIKHENSRLTTYCEKTKRITDEKYILKISDNKIQITCSGEKSEFYALTDLAKKIKENSISEGEFVSSPSFGIRGYIEGFYGKPWSHESRKSVLTLMAKNRMNTVFYAPKDDLYHRDLWREKYPEDELKNLKELSDLSREYFMTFFYCIAPGLTMKYSDNTEFEALIEKTKQLYSIGITHFGLLLDDIDEELNFEEDKKLFGETVNAHIELITSYYSALKEIDVSAKLTVCPTLYHGKGNEYYISKLGTSISPLISLFWTGKDICSRELTTLEALKFYEHTHHKPLYWDNYPVNDCSMYNEMHISPIINRDADLWKYSEGIISNCMEYAECSKIPLITFADYLWDSENYNSQTSWENAIKQVIGEEHADIFTVFADHLYTSCLKDVNSRRMYKVLDKIETAFKSGDKQTAFSLAEEYLGKMLECRKFLMQDLPICRELTKWSEKFYVACDLTEKIFNFVQTGENDLKEEILSLIDKYNSMPARLSNDTDIKGELEGLFSATN